jgi:hypothetical protein
LDGDDGKVFIPTPPMPIPIPPIPIPAIICEYSALPLIPLGGLPEPECAEWDVLGRDEDEGGGIIWVWVCG